MNFFGCVRAFGFWIQKSCGLSGSEKTKREGKKSIYLRPADTEAESLLLLLISGLKNKTSQQ